MSVKSILNPNMIILYALAFVHFGFSYILGGALIVCVKNLIREAELVF